MTASVAYKYGVMLYSFYFDTVSKEIENKFISCTFFVHICNQGQACYNCFYQASTGRDDNSGYHKHFSLIEFS